MKITIESTTKIIEFNGLPARVWEGTTESGIRVHSYITRVAISKDEPEKVLALFRSELSEQRAPSPEVEAIPLRMIL